MKTRIERGSERVAFIETVVLVVNRTLYIHRDGYFELACDACVLRLATAKWVVPLSSALAARPSPRFAAHSNSAPTRP
jgi:hypothetical protein